MKNVYLIPTDKPSRLVIDTIENKLYLQPILHEKTLNVIPQHIYITNDEEIKEDWVLSLTDDESYLEVYKYDGTTYLGEDKKIILTTDPDLIKDGVQAIDDEFLEWFINNPNHESVKVRSKMNHPRSVFGYEIIIP